MIVIGLGRVILVDVNSRNPWVSLAVTSLVTKNFPLGESFWDELPYWGLFSSLLVQEIYGDLVLDMISFP